MRNVRCITPTHVVNAPHCLVCRRAERDVRARLPSSSRTRRACMAPRRASRSCTRRRTPTIWRSSRRRADVYEAAESGALVMLSITENLTLDKAAYPFVLPNTQALRRFARRGLPRWMWRTAGGDERRAADRRAAAERIARVRASNGHGDRHPQAVGNVSRPGCGRICSCSKPGT